MTGATNLERPEVRFAESGFFFANNVVSDKNGIIMGY